MCGIAGAFSLAGPLDPAVRASVPAMTSALRHRGPDGDGFFDDGIASLGHRRLAIIDIARGHQPLSNEDGSVWIVFNGEVYNHNALREWLEGRGHVFRTACDTEAIVHAYEEEGPACVSRFVGMFAFVIYDAKTRSVFAARDRLGKKPFFYTTVGSALCFGSELSSLQAVPGWSAEHSDNWLETYLALGYIPAPATAFKNVFKLPPGHLLVARESRVETRRYWDVEEFDTERRPFDAVVDELDHLLAEAVHCRLESEVPLGAFLSGGIDSGLVVSHMSGSSAPMTVSVGFDDHKFNELDAAQLTASALGTTHRPLTIRPQLEGLLDRAVASFGEPFADASAIPTYYVSKAAREYVTVALTGDGGDESFAGYDFRYIPHLVESWARHLVPALVRRPLLTLGRHWPGKPSWPKPLRLRTVFQNLGGSDAEAYFADLCMVKPERIGPLLGREISLRGHAAYDLVTSTYGSCGSAAPLQRAEYADLKMYLPNAPLAKVDRMSMLNSLEVRCPLLDHRIVEFAFRVPRRLKLRHLKGKALLRAIAARRLPGQIATLPKRGFSAPISSWITSEHAQLFTADVLSTTAPIRDLLDQGAIQQLLVQHSEGVYDHAQLLWAIWMASRWLVVSRPAVLR
jgi:asparagine synthase (glutamine-hydrolysing)